MPVTTILQHAIQRELPVKAEAASNAHNGKNEGSLISGHIPVEANLNTVESSSPQKYRASKVKRAAPAISSGSSRHPKQPRNASASRRRRKSRPSSTQIASESGHYTFVSEIFPSLEPISLGASFFIPFGMANGTATYEQSPKGTWEPQLNYCHTPPASSTNCTNEKAFPSAYTAAEDMLNPLNSHSTTASPSTNQRSSGQRSSFASSSEPISPSSYFTAQSCPRGYKNAQTSIEDNNTTGAGNEPVSDTNPQETSCLQHINQQAVESLREEEEEEEEEEAVHHVAASRLAEIPQPAIIKQAVPTIEQVPPAQAKVAAQEKVNSKQITSPQPRRTLRSSSAPYPGMSPQSASPESEESTTSKGGLPVGGELTAHRELFAFTSGYNQTANRNCTVTSGGFISSSCFVCISCSIPSSYFIPRCSIPRGCSPWNNSSATSTAKKTSSTSYRGHSTPAGFAISCNSILCDQLTAC
ncbi:hypothetical protein M441DRAFT_129355 [Trichoderma asperellum CBS 433.97]|uniref:Uncharacterized protein n=1 Tax=Trichoderma asperellum (strain ATCC 204424 / CBS 433.97 / NBRC 101777) TaxID=1042311 RepID=A0A2T3ZJU7_TRIA4|nr:hypothetical protein M441DRAFT_129355 [Trichoderma asperellum CBS 433.97]PTB45076.1 hypothetical protein M441DRAFT_129355 [Trichoderma asperellum CBS 433.97]